MSAAEKTNQTLRGIYLGDILRVLWKRKWLIATFTAIFLALGIVLKWKETPVFAASSKFVCTSSDDSKMSELGALASLAGIKAGSSAGSNPSLYFSDILEDDEILGKILARKWNYRGDSLSLVEIYSLHPDTTIPDWEYVFLKESIDMLKDGKSIILTKNRANGVFVLETNFPGPKLAYQVNLYVIELLSEYLRTSLLTKTREKRSFIEKRLSEIEIDLGSGEDKLTAFKQGNKDVFSPNILLQQARLERSVRINQELYLQMKKELEMAKIQEKNDTPLLEVLSKPTVPIEKTPGKGRFLILAGFAVGLGLGVTSALGLAWYQKELV